MPNNYFYCIPVYNIICKNQNGHYRPYDAYFQKSQKTLITTLAISVDANNNHHYGRKRQKMKITILRAHLSKSPQTAIMY
jgi:hypothetical protein